MVSQKVFASWLLLNNKGQVTGKIELHESGVLMMVKSVRASVHHFNNPPGWATDTKHLSRLRALAADSGTPDPFVRLDVRDNYVSRTMFARLSQFDRFGRAMEHGHGHQTVLADRYWQGEAPQGMMI